MSTHAPRKFGDADLTQPPAPPAQLDDREAAVWDEVVPQLVRRRVLARMDVEAVARYCRAVALEHRARDEWEQEGRPMVAVGSTGQPRPHPLVGVMRDARSDAARLGAALLLDPASRARAGEVAGPEASTANMRDDRARRDALIAEHGELYSWRDALLHEDGTPYPADAMPGLVKILPPDHPKFAELYPDGPPARRKPGVRMMSDVPAERLRITEW